MTDTFESPYCATCASRLVSIFDNVEESNLETMASTKACNMYKKGEVIFREGDSRTGVFCVHTGKIKVYKTGDEGKQHIVRFAKEGDVLGYRSLMIGEPYSVSAAALEDCVVCRIPKDTFFKVFHTDQAFTERVVAVLSGELRQAEDRMVKLAQKPVRERLAETLLILREVYGTENGDESPINVTLSREELASVVGTATETLVRALADLKKEQLIATDKKKIRILDVSGLARVGNLQD